jgi:hypothetical protein
MQAEQEEFRKLILHLERLRDALVSLSMSASDLVFEANRSEDATSACKAYSVIEKMKSQLGTSGGKTSS